MTIRAASIYHGIPTSLPSELCQTLLEKPILRIERIVSRGHSSDWYDQDNDEWVMLLQGEARLTFADGGELRLTAGDYLLIPAHCKHRVDWTAPDRDSIWLAIHIGSER